MSTATAATMKLARVAVLSLVIASNVRLNYDEDSLRQLGSSLKKRQEVPLLIRPDMTIIDGHRRYLAAKLVGLQYLDCLVTESEGIETLETQLVTSLQRADLTPFEQYEGFTAWLAAVKATAKDLAEKIDRDPAQVTRVLSLSRCVPRVKDAAAAGKLSVAEWYALSKLPPEEQLRKLAKKLGDPAEGEESESDEPGTAGSLRIEYPAKRTIIVKGVNSLAEIAKFLKEASKDCERAHEDGLSPKSYQNVMRDRSKKVVAQK